ncbi:MAG TPA: SdrD B-like domain-containing protein, partial [Candidatus Limnocylindrales bacterium]|nr:SdrD B-like domain-containing protein [Candidatus Limnocylindrales bacterium]
MNRNPSYLIALAALLLAFTCVVAILLNWSGPAAPAEAAPGVIEDLPAQAATATRTPTPINIGNFVWDDLDQDGRQDAGEPGLAGVTVQLWNSAKTTMIMQSSTNANGNYTVVAPVPGSYRVRVVLPTINDQFSPKDNAAAGDTADSDINPTGANLGFTDILSIASNVISISNVDAGIIKFRTATPTRTPTPVNFGNFVWDDLDQDGRQDAGEPGLAGITVQLWNSGKTTLIDQDVTNSSGIYSLQSPGPGNYRVRVVLPTINDQFSPKDQAGGDDTDDSDINPTGGDIGFTDIIAVASNVISISSIDAGIIKFRTATPTRTPTPINIGNFVWDDLDQDGRQDAGEPGLPGVTVQLWNSDKSQMLFQTTTSGSGIYSVVAPLPG